MEDTFFLILEPAPGATGEPYSRITRTRSRSLARASSKPRLLAMVITHAPDHRSVVQVQKAAPY